MRQRLRTIRALVLEQMPQVLACQQPKQVTSARREPGELKIDESRGAIVAHQNIWLLGEIVVHDSSAVQPPQQPRGSIEIGGVGGLAAVHRHTWDIAANKQVLRNYAQCEPRHPAACAVRVAHNKDYAVIGRLSNFTKQVLFEQRMLSHCNAWVVTSVVALAASP